MPQIDEKSSSNCNHFLSIIKNRYEINQNQQRPLRIQVGIDFGTSYSKVAWRFGETCFPLCFGENRDSLDDYLVPSTITFDGKTFITGVDYNQHDLLNNPNQITNFKICVACESQTDSCDVRNCKLTNWDYKKFSPEAENVEAVFAATLYLSKLVSASKKRIRNELEKKGIARPTPIKWLITTSVPERFSEKEQVIKIYDKVLRTACLMAEVFTESPLLNSRRDIFSLYSAAVDFEESNPKMDCFTYPEVAAQVASVTMSRTTEEGLYAYVDIGAGTVDASVFRFSRLAVTPLSTYATSVYKLGSTQIEAEICKSLPHFPPSEIKNLKENLINKTNKLLQDKELSEDLRDLCVALSDATNMIKGNTRTSLNSLLDKAYEKEKFDDVWKGLKLILGGGGAGINAYRSAANNAFTMNGNLPKLSNLPIPDDFQLQGLPSESFHRFAVAYGVSFPYLDLPEVASSDDVKPLTKKVRFKVNQRPVDKRWV